MLRNGGAAAKASLTPWESAYPDTDQGLLRQLYLGSWCDARLTIILNTSCEPSQSLSLELVHEIEDT